MRAVMIRTVICGDDTNLATLVHFSHFRSSHFVRIKSQFDRLALVMVSIQTGIELIREKFVVLPTDEFDVGQPMIIEETLSDVIRSSGDVLVDVHSKTKENELQMDLQTQDTKFTELKRATSQSSNLQARRPMTSGVTEDRPFNQRITLPSAKEISVFDQDDGDESVFGVVDALEELSRDGVKKASSNIIATEERRKLRSNTGKDI